MSDLHLEFGDLNVTNNGADVLILSGDIMIAEDLHSHPEMDYGNYTNVNLAELGRRQEAAFRFRNFLKRCSEAFPHVIYVAGNHEFYHGRWKGSLDHLRQECNQFPNVYFMENDIKTIGDFTFIGCTLWTDCNNGDPLTLHALGGMMNDYRIIRNDEQGYSKLRPAHTMSRHVKSKQYISTIVEGKHDQKFVVVGHHAPCKQSTHPRYANDQLMNGGYSSDLSEFILERPQIKLWTHGHTHYSFDYMVGDTRIICNPRGYDGYAPNPDFSLDTIIEV